MKEKTYDRTLQAWLVTALAGSWLLSETALADPPADLADATGVFEVIETSEEDDHEGAIITIARTERAATGSFFKGVVYGLGFIQANATNAQKRDEGFLCDRSQVIGNQRRSAGCSKPLANNKGERTGLESLQVGTLNSNFCEVLRSIHGEGIILEDSDERCDGEDNSGNDDPDDDCICYEIDIDTGTTPFGPPSEGTGTARRGG